MSAHPRYELLEKIASGSFATVYRGRDVELGREVAIKQIHDQYLQDPRQLDRYWQEAQLLASFQHPNIVTIFDVVRDRGWLILELMQSDLSRVAGRKQMPLESLRTTLAHCLRALKFLHAHGIVHGDVKPSNMMIDRRRRVKLGDFGLARRVSDEGGSLIKGTTKYMAPEVVSDEFGEVGPASDLYSLGFAAFELVCGENFESLFPGLSAFGRDRQMAWMMWHAAPDRRLPEIQRVLADVPADLARTIQKLTAKPQSERYRTADQALSDLNIDLKLVGAGDQTLDGLGKTTVGSAPTDRRRWLAIGAFSVSLLACLAALFWPGGGGSPVTGSPEKPRSGVVREIRADEGKIVIDDEHGFPEEIDVGKNPRIRLDGDQHPLLRELKPHDRVEITMPPSAGAAVQIAALRPIESRGTIKSIDPEAAKLTASFAADPHPQDVPMYVPKAAQLLLNGKSVDLADLLPSDRIDVLHLKDTQGRAARDVVRLEARRAVTMTGFVHEVQTIGTEKWLIVDGHGVLKPVKFAGDCRITIDGQTSQASAAFLPADLRPGDRITVTHDTHVTAVVAERRGRMTGALIKIDPGAREIVVRAPDGQEVKFHVGEACVLRIDDQPATLEELKSFDKLEVTFDESGPDVTEAKTIDASHPRKSN